MGFSSLFEKKLVDLVRCGYKLSSRSLQSNSRNMSSKSDIEGLVIGAYQTDKKEIKLTKYGEEINKKTDGKLLRQLKLTKTLKNGDTRVFWELHDQYKAICVVGLGDESLAYNPQEQRDERREAVRVASCAGLGSLKSLGLSKIIIESLDDAESAVEGAHLANWAYREHKSKSNDDVSTEVDILHEGAEREYTVGKIKAQAQNFARQLAEAPANFMTPTILANKAEQALKEVGVNVIKHDLEWIKSEKMGSFLSVAQGSEQPPMFLEMSYNNAPDKATPPYVLVGKGVTFDSGGLSLKPSDKMDQMRADMTGAAVVVATMKAIAELKLPLHVVALTPLTENLPSGKATKPGDIVIAKNGKSICVDNTDAEGRLILADALCYAAKFNPKLVVELSTLTGAIKIALGNAATGVFTNSDKFYNDLVEASAHTGDRVWRMPIWKCFGEAILSNSGYDVNNCPPSRFGSSNCAALFLKEFVPENCDWAHLDIAAVMGPESDDKYLKKGQMLGRPARTLIQLLINLAQKK